MNYLIYKHTNLINNKVYIGQTCQDPQKRWGKNGKGYENQNFYKAIMKYGWDNFKHEILEENIPKEQIDEKEKYQIELYKANDPEYGYNLTSGGQKDLIFTEEVKEKIKNSFTEEKRREQSERLKKRWQEDEEWIKTSTMARNSKHWHPIGELNPMYNTHRTGKDAARKKKVKCIETGEIFDTIIEAARWSNNGKESNKSHISDVCKGKRKSCGKHPDTGVPLHWEQVEEEDK